MIRALLIMLFAVWVAASGAQLAGGLLLVGGACWGTYWVALKFHNEKAVYDRWEGNERA